MNNNFTDRHKELKAKLFTAVRLSKKKRAVRVLNHPWRMLYPKLMNITKRNKEVKVRVFWGGEMSLVIPEIVSINIWRYGYFEEDVCLLMLNILEKGMTFIDIGAHYGFFTLLGSFLVEWKGKVLAFEPTPATYEKLQNNIIRHSRYPNVETYNWAAYSEDVQVNFYDYGGRDAAFNSLFKSKNTSASVKSGNLISAKAIKIDSILTEKRIEHVDLIKIDAESSEIHVLKGMTETLSNYRPRIIIELGDFKVPGVPRSEEIIIWLQRINYSPYEVHDGKIRRHHKRDRYGSCNLLFVAE